MKVHQLFKFDEAQCKLCRLYKLLTTAVLKQTLILFINKNKYFRLKSL